MASVRETTRTTLRRSARPRRVMPAEVRVDDLMNAAAELFIAQGIEGTTVDAVAAAAGVGKGTFYHYFATKTDVLLALRQRFTQIYREQVDSAIKGCPPDDHHGQFKAWIRAAVGTYMTHYRLHDVVFHDFHHDRRRSDEKDVVIDQLAAILEAGMTAGAWRVPNSRAAALILFDGMHGVVDDAIAVGRFDPQPLCDVLEELLSRVLR